MNNNKFIRIVMYLLVRSTGKPNKIVVEDNSREELYYFDFILFNKVISFTFEEKKFYDL